MNSHTIFEEQLEAYTLGALDPTERATFEAHLASCAVCQGEVASYAPVLHALHTLPMPDAPKISKRRPSMPRFLNVLYPVAAAFLFGVGTTAGSMFERAQTNDMVTVAAMAASSAKEVRLDGAQARGRALVGNGRLRTAFVIEGLPKLPSGHVYQVWLQGATTTSPGVLRRTRDGYEVLVVAGDLLESGPEHVAVTIEPAAGVATMTGDAVASGDT